MRIISASDLASILTPSAMIEALRQGFRQSIVTPLRHHHTMTTPGATENFLLLMPAWTDRAAGDPVHGSYAGVKLVTVYPHNPAENRPTVQGQYLLIDAVTGSFLAAIDGTSLTLWRTAAASALAASYLARKDACRLVMVGTGAMAPYLVRAHMAVSPITSVSIWNRNIAKAEALAAELGSDGIDAVANPDLEGSIKAADIVSCATVSTEPIVQGKWLKDGAHVDLMGAFTPAHRETDDEVMKRGRVFVDTMDGALKEAGDIIQAIESGVLKKDDIVADLFGLCRDKIPGRQSEKEITVFKSVGTALEDLVAAQFIYELIGSS
ncbi:MAG: ornithine cyclodeaminase family protein [Fimbriimonadaceae bacterium]|nr:ornithine cyclodeaminase family protein [Alphaproteobacteria bacterium]